MLMGDFNKLAKGKLSIIVTLTAGAGFVLGSGETVDWAKLGWTCAGTWACSAAANTCNQIYEIRNDSFMKRTMLRPLPAGRMSPITALAFAAVTGLSGAYMLQTQVWPCMYWSPMKQQFSTRGECSHPTYLACRLTP